MSKSDTNLEGELYCDTRLGGVKRWYYNKPKDANMRLPDEVIDSVCFLCVKARDDYGEYDHFIGTAFFVSCRFPSSAHPYTYLVTARHVIKGAKKDGHTDFYVRLNYRKEREGGRGKIIPLPDEWEYPENEGIDVAVIPFTPETLYFQYVTFPDKAMLTSEKAKEEGIGIGDDLVITGLFQHRWGEYRNIPIVRSGNIAAMPTEPLVDKEGNLYDAYLVETRSIGGLSGSPVFVIREVMDFERNVVTPDVEIFLLGLIRSHYDLKKQGITKDTVASEIDVLNTGIAEVVPIQEAVNLINGEVLMKRREDADRARRMKHMSTKDSNLPKKRLESERSDSITQEGFQDALMRASRKISQPDEEKKET